MGRRHRSRLPKGIQRKNGTVYMVAIEIEGRVLYKVGATGGNPRKRVMQVVESIEQAYGYFPRCEVIEDSKCKNYYQVERKIHTALAEYAYCTKEAFSGSTELFECDVSVVRQVYKECISADEGIEEDNTFEW